MIDPNAVKEGLGDRKLVPFWARPTFWASVMAGITAPSMIFAQPPSYTGMIRDFSVAGSFAAVGALLSKNAREQA